MFQDYKDLLSAFHSHGVKYLIVGGYAVILHAQPRFTRDLDVFVKADAANAKAMYAALSQFGAPLQNTRPEDFADCANFFRFGSAPHAVDILPEIPGIDFDAAWQRRVETTIDPDTGLTAFFISRDDLIASKLASGRPQDIADTEAIRRAVQSQQPETKQNSPTPTSGPGE